MSDSISIIGGDSRQLYAAEYLINRGYKVSIFACEHGKFPEKAKRCTDIENAMNNEIIILPLPVTKNGSILNAPLSANEIKIKDITDRINEGHTVFYGMGSISLSRHIQAKSRRSIDYYNIEQLIYKNALLTAEGLISIILDKIPTTLFGMNIAVTGYGRISFFVADKLHKLGAKVSIFARNELQLVKAESMGYSTYQLKEISKKIAAYDCLINTIPYPVIDRYCINNSKKDCVFIEAASAPYGIDADACSDAERILIKAFSLPGKTAPKSAGIIIGETIDSVLKGVNS